MKILVLILVIFLMFSFTASNTNTTSETYTLINGTNLVKPGCASRCGNLIVPYPFGIGLNSNCSIGEGFDIYCNTSIDPPRPSFSEAAYTHIKLISDSTVHSSNSLAERCYYPNGSISKDYYIERELPHPPYTFSEVNKYTVIGCREYAWLHSRTMSRNVSTGCMVFCLEPEDVLSNQCSGNGCCQSSIPKDSLYYNTSLNTFLGADEWNSTTSFNPCTYAFIGDENVFKFRGAADLNDPSFVERIEATVPIVLDWAIGNLSCSEAQTTNDFACKSNSACVDSTRESGGYRCSCKEGYHGNPYLSPGCQDIDECKDSNNYPCYGTCVNTPGNYTCKCKSGYSGDGKIQDGCRRKPFKILEFFLGTGLGLLIIFIVLCVLYITAKKRTLVKRRESFFERNGGALLKEKLKTQGVANSMKIFSVEELEEATKNYAEDMILGRGGHGIVYKGILPDKRVVAIKKSQKLDQGEREQFINEMAILSQVNHPNVVKLVGCCLETDVPSLVYEFVPNGTLYHHIHNKSSGMTRFSWDKRLRIASESADALAHLHSSASIPIIHRDVKSSNILLDGNYTTKIADFGASRVVPLGDAQVATLVQGTLGYLDPEYLQTGNLTDKSDVYSLGVVLAELLTGEKPVGTERSQSERSLATYFVKAVKENRLVQILEPQVAREATFEQLEAIGELAYRCLKLASGDRPSMKEVAMELESLRKNDKYPWVSRYGHNEISSVMIESGEVDLYTIPLINNSDTFGEYSSSSTRMNDTMFQAQSPR